MVLNLRPAQMLLATLGNSSLFKRQLTSPGKIHPKNYE